MLNFVFADSSWDNTPLKESFFLSCEYNKELGGYMHCMYTQSKFKGKNYCLVLRKRIVYVGPKTTVKIRLNRKKLVKNGGDRTAFNHCRNCPFYDVFLLTYLGSIVWHQRDRAIGAEGQ